MLTDLRNRYSNRFHAFKSKLPYLSRAFQLVWESAKWYAVIWLGLLTIQGILPIVLIELTRITIDTIIAFVANEGPDETSVFGWGTALATLTILSIFIGTIINWINTIQGELVKDHLSSLIQQQALYLDLSHFEHRNYFDQLYRARIDARLRPLKLLQNSGMLLQHLITTLGLTALMVSYSPWIAPLLIVGTLPVLVVVIRYSDRYNWWRLRNTVDERRADYFDSVLTDYTAAAEVRLFQAGEYYRNKFNRLRDRIRRERFVIERSKVLNTLLALTLGLFTVGGAMGWMLLRVINGMATLGELVAFYQIFSRGQTAMRSVINTAGSIYNDIHFLENLFEFFELEPRLYDQSVRAMLPTPLTAGIRFENVSFRYPGSERSALENFNWEIPAGKIVALVGENGEGKSTLMKLLCRLFDPTDGVVTWDNVNIKDLPLQDLWRQVTFLFQNPIRYMESARHNIIIGDLATELSQEAIENASKTAGSHDFIMRLPQQYETILGKWFGGEELSVGEWQRLGLARAFVRRAGVIILDEPTSAMDSWAELDWLQRFRKIADNSTAVIVTHRFTTAMQADLICVIRNGKIIEQGTHEELVRQEGHYATSWLAQVTLSKERK